MKDRDWCVEYSHEGHMTIGECITSGGHWLNNRRCSRCGHSPGNPECSCPTCDNGDKEEYVYGD